MSTVYGVVNESGIHTDIGLTERGAKVYATKNGYNLVSVRRNGDYHPHIIAHKVGKTWQDGEPPIVREDAPAPAEPEKDMRRPMAVKTVGQYMTRDGRQVSVTQIIPDKGFVSVQGLIWQHTPHGYAPNGKMNWDQTGKYSVLMGLSPFDIVSHWDESKIPFEVLEPGEYLLRNGMRVTVDEVRHGTLHMFKVCGRIWRKFRGKVRPRKNDVWMMSGHIKAVGLSDFDIVSKFTGGVQNG